MCIYIINSYLAWTISIGEGPRYLSLFGGWARSTFFGSSFVAGVEKNLSRFTMMG